MALEELYNYGDNSPFGYFDGDNLFTMQNEWIGFRRRDNVFDRHTNRFTHFRAGRFFYRVSDNQPVWFFAG